MRRNEPTWRFILFATQPRALPLHFQRWHCVLQDETRFSWGFHGLDLESEGFIIPIGKLKACYDSDPLTSPMLGHCMWHELLPCSLAVPLLFFAWAYHKKIQLLWWGILFASFCRCDGSTVTIEWNLSAIFAQLLMLWYWSLLLTLSCPAQTLYLGWILSVLFLVLVLIAWFLPGLFLVLVLFASNAQVKVTSSL